MAAVVFALTTSGCAGFSAGAGPGPHAVVYGISDSDKTADSSIHAPAFAVVRADRSYNRIGVPRATARTGGRVRIAVDPDTAAVFTETRAFTGRRGAYENHIYRVHFPRVPYRLRPSHVSAGRNVGLLAIVTVDAHDRPVLLTTVHTCGCYVAFFPTQHLPASADPAGWNRDRQRVWGERLPGQVQWDTGSAGSTPTLWLRDGTHRVMDVTSAPPDSPVHARRIALPLRPMADLDRLPVAGGDGARTTSLFIGDGVRAGYVRGSIKPLEMLAASWWAWDLWVGSDKRYGAMNAPGPVFYTSLKPWRRHASDMRDFAAFLRYWGWDL